MEIRNAQLTDISAIAKIHFTAWKNVYRGQVLDVYLDNLKFHDFFHRWYSYITDKINKTLVLEKEDIILGFISFGSCSDPELQQKDVAEILYIYVSSDFRSKGFGSLLYKKAEEIIRLEKYKAICIKVLASNVPACRFYEKLGFHLDKIYKNDCKFKGLKLSEKLYLIKIES